MNSSFDWGTFFLGAMVGGGAIIMAVWALSDPDAEAELGECRRHLRSARVRG
jgi:hypothetical protein